MLGGKGRTLVLFGVFFLCAGFAFEVDYFIVFSLFCLFATVFSLPQFDASLNIDDLKVERILESKTMFQDSFLHVKVKVTNNGGKQFNFIDIFDDYNAETFHLVAGENYISTRINPHQTIVFSYIIEPKIRGEYDIGPLTVVVKDRLGFNSEERVVPDSIDDITIYPPYEIIKKIEAMAQQRAINRSFGVHRSRIKGMGTEFYGMRRYVYGDQFRSIDWKASVRSQKLIVKEFETDRAINVIIMIDSSESMAGGAVDNTKFEFSIRAAMLLTKIALEQKDRVGAITFSDRKHYRFLEPSGRTSHFFTMLDFLGRVMPKFEAKFEETCEEFCRRYSRRSLIIILSDLEGSQEDIALGVKKLRAYGHTVMVISPFSPWFEAHELELSPTDKALAEAVSEETMEHLIELKPKLEQFNAQIIYVGPDDFLNVVLAEYAKARKAGKGEH
ncbi:MAG: DUF58 domain-containing protein [Candidatus Lokiarchaeota archaeon]|nr:DUF58 domain-containing protein [Candidatus Lokiarchaeota archaeon]